MVDVSLPTTLPVAYQHGAEARSLRDSDQPSTTLDQLSAEFSLFSSTVSQLAATGQLSPAEGKLPGEWVAEWLQGFSLQPYIDFGDGAIDPSLPGSDDPCHLVGQRLFDAIGQFEQLKFVRDGYADADLDGLIANSQNAIENLSNISLLNYIGNGAKALSQGLFAVDDVLINFESATVQAVSAASRAFYNTFAKFRDGVFLSVDVGSQATEAAGTGKVSISVDSVLDAIQLGVALRSESTLLATSSAVLDAGQSVKTVGDLLTQRDIVVSNMTFAVGQLNIFKSAKQDLTAIENTLQGAYDNINGVIQEYTGSCVSDLIFEDGEIVSPSHPVGSPPPHADVTNLQGVVPLSANEYLAPDFASVSNLGAQATNPTGIEALPAQDTPSQQLMWYSAPTKQTVMEGTLQADNIMINGDDYFILSGAGDDVVNAYGSDCIVFGGYGNDTVDFGSHNFQDSAGFSGNYSDYDISIDGEWVVVTDKRVGQDGIDRVRGADVLFFADGARTIVNLTNTQASGVTPFTGITSENVSALLAANELANANAASPPGSVPVYRFFDTKTGTQFLTSSMTERDSLLNTRPDLTSEGIGLNAVDGSDPNASAVYRFFDKVYGTHFFTQSTSERDNIQANRSDLFYEGVGFYEYGIQQVGSSPVYRFFDSNLGTHFFTSSAAERSAISSFRPDLIDEGISFYAPIS